MSHKFDYCPARAVTMVLGTAYDLGRYEPSSPPAKELHGWGLLAAFWGRSCDFKKANHFTFQKIGQFTAHYKIMAFIKITDFNQPHKNCSTLWQLQVMWQVLTNQSALFQSDNVTTLKFCHEIGSWCWKQFALPATVPQLLPSF